MSDRPSLYNYRSLSFNDKVKHNLQNTLPEHEKLQFYIENIHIVFMIIVLIFLIVKINIDHKLENKIHNATNQADINYYQDSKNNIENILTYSELVMYPFFLSSILFLKWYSTKISNKVHIA